MKNRFSKFLSVLLSVCMILSMTSVMVFAEDEEVGSVDVQEEIPADSTADEEAASDETEEPVSDESEPVAEEEPEETEEVVEEEVLELTEVDDTADLAGTPTYYVKWGGTGDGLTATTPVATVADAVKKINAAGYGAGDVVTVYIMNDDTLTEEQTSGNPSADFYMYDQDGNYRGGLRHYDSTNKKGLNIVGRQTAWKQSGGSPDAHTATLLVKGYTDDAMLFYSHIIGHSAHLVLNGPTIFEDLTIVATRMYDVVFFTNGYDVTFNNVDFKHQNTDNSSAGAAYSGLLPGHHRLSPSANGTASKGGSTITYNTPVLEDADSRYGVIVASNQNATFTGHVKFYLNGKSKNGYLSWGNGISTFNDGLSVVANAGTYKHMNRNSNVSTIKGGLQFVANNGAAFTNLSDVTARFTADGLWQMNSADTSGNALDVTDTAGTFTVKGGNVAYVVADAGKTVYYSVNGSLTVPAGTYDVSYATDLDAVKAAVVPFEDAANEFVEWIDNGNGTLTAAYRATGEDVVYYVKHGATGSGLTEQNPGSFATVIDNINSKYTADDTVIIKVIKADNEADSYASGSTIEIASIADIRAHEAMLVITSADTENPTWLTHANGKYQFATNDTGSNVELSGPLTLENINVVDARTKHHCDLYTNAYDFKIGEGVNWYSARYDSTKAVLNFKGAAWNGAISGASRGNSTTASTFNRAFTMDFVGDIIKNCIISASGYHESTNKNMKQDVTIKLGTGTNANVRIDGMKDGATYTIFDKNVNFVFDGTTVAKLYNNGLGPVVKGAVQIIKNNGATITSNTSVAHTTTDRNVETPVYDITVETGITLDVTETAGVYTVAGDNIAYAQSEDLKTAYYSIDGVLTLPEAGAWTVKNAADMTALKAALTVPSYSIQYTFKEWVDDEEGTITASATENADPEISKYYVQYGASGTGLTYDSPIGTIAGAIKAINADGWGEGENVTVYLVPTGNEPTLAQLNYKNTNDGNPPIKLGEANGFIYFAAPNVAHTATITYTTYNYGAEGVEKMILANGDTVTLADSTKPNSWRGGLSHMYISGPTVFKDLMIIDLRTDASNDFYTQGHNFTLENCDWRQTAYNASPLGGYTWEDWKNHFYLGNHGSLTYSQNANSDGVVIVDNPSLINDLNLICRGEKNGTSFAYFGNDTTASTLPVVYNTNNNTAIQHGVANYIFNNTTITKLINKTESVDKDKDGTPETYDMTYPTADAVQIILNNGSSITTNTAKFNADVYILNVADGGKLDATEEVGVYTVDTDKKYAYAYAGGEKIYYAEAGSTISVDEPGVYEVGFFDSLSEVKTTFESEVDGYVFAGWSDDGKGTLTATTKPVDDTVAMYYAMYGGNGDGRTPDAPANTVADAINSINADVASGVLTAGQEVTVYVSSASDWQTYNADAWVGKDANPKTPEHHMTAWKSNGGQPAAYSVILNVQSYDYINFSYMPSNQNLGANESLDTNGITKFDHIAIVDTRFGYREFELHGNNTYFGKNTIFAHLDVGSAEANAKWGGKFGLDAGNITLGAYVAETYNNDIEVVFNNAFSMLGSDRGIFLGSSVSNKAVFNGNSSLYLNNPGIETSIQWSSVGENAVGDVTVAKNLNLIFSDAKKIIYRARTSKNLMVTNTLTVKNLQIIAKDGIEYLATDGTTAITVDTIPANVIVTGGQWILKLAEGVDNFLDVTSTAGTFTVEAGLVAKATNDATGAVTLSNNGTLALEAGTYTIESIDQSEVESTTVTVTFDGVSDGNLYVEGQTFALPEKDNELLREFKGWTLDGGATILAAGTLQICGVAGTALAYTSVWENFPDTVAIYVDGNAYVVDTEETPRVKGTQPTVIYIGNGNDNNDGLTPENPVKTLAKAFEIADARPESIKKIAIIGNYPYSFKIPENENPIIITGDGSGDSAIELYYDSIYLKGDVKFENINLRTTTLEGGKILYSNSYNLEFGEGVVIDSALNVRLGGDQKEHWGNKLVGTFESGIFKILEVGNFWVSTNRATASGADVVIDGAHIDNINFTSNGWLETQLGCDFTGPVRVLVNSGKVGTIDMTTQAENAQKYAAFKDTVEILSNNAATTKISDQFVDAAEKGAWIVTAGKAADGSVLEYTDTIGTYKINGNMTAIATTPDNQQYVSIDGVLTVPAGIYTVEFVDKIEYIINGDTVSFYSTVTLDLSALKVPLHEGKAFIGWFLADGTAPAYNTTEFKPGDVLTATYIDYVEETGAGLNTTGDFFIKGAQIRLGSTEKDAVNGLRYIVEMDNSFYAALTQYSESIINPENPNYGTLILPTTLTKGRSMFYNKPIVVEWNLSDGKLGSKDSPYDLDQAYNATPITTNSIFKKEYTPSAVPAVKTYGKTSTAKQYTVCLTGISQDNYTEFYSVRGYIRYIDANGFERVWYSDYYQTNMHKMANAAIQKGETGEFLTEIINYVEAKPGEGGLYDDYMAANYDNRTLLSGYSSTEDKDPNHAMYKLANGLTVREIEINYSGSETDDPVEIVHFADTHLNWINEEDLYKAVPSTISTYRGRSWLRNGSSTAAITTAMEYGMLFDQMVITGDIMDYFSWGCAEIMQKLIIDRDSNAMLALGNHEPAENMQNDASVGSYYGGRTGIYPLLQDIWPNDIYYYSKIVYNDDGKAKAMCVTLNNEQDVYIAEQGTKLKADIAKARELGIPVLLFQHDPICTNNPEDDPRWFFYKGGDWTWMKWNANNANHANFPKDASDYILATKYDPEIHDAMGLTPYKLNNYDTLWVNCEATNALVPPDSAWYSQRGAGKPSSNATTMEVYNVIVSNADVVKGVFCGHVHNHMYTEIKATYVDEHGATVNTVIPQYCVTANAYDNGNTIKITVK